MRLDIEAIEAAYDAGETPASVLGHVYGRIAGEQLNPVWISLVSRERIEARAAALGRADRAGLPLYGVPFAVKDNMDVAGMGTTAACPAFAYTATETATAIRRLEDAGAVLVGKTNLDQFATGLVGTRSPFGACSSVFDADHISGGSSSGSAVAVARGLVSFALGTDTAGSGRVPAAFNNLVGLKPTRGALSTRGVVPACRSLDCVSVFGLTAGDAARVFDAARGFDPADSFSRLSAGEDAPALWLPGPFRFGVPRESQWEFFGDGEAQKLYESSVAGLESLGGVRAELDFRPFAEAAALLYAGPWVAERLAALGGFFASHADDVNPIVRGIIEGASKYSAVDAFTGLYRLEELRRESSQAWRDADVLLLPTTGTTYTRAQVEADPVRLNTNLGYYTNFANLFDLAVVAVPAGLRPNGLPFGVSLVGAAGNDRALLRLGDRLHRRMGGRLGGTSTLLGDTRSLSPPIPPPGCVPVAVVGAHLTGQPLNHQLTSRGARLTAATRTAAGYRLYALPGTAPPKPGLIRDPGAETSIEVEVWAVPTAHFGGFVAAIPAPLGIGSVALADGSSVSGFICEPFAVEGAREITQFGGWRAYLASGTAVPV